MHTLGISEQQDEDTRRTLDLRRILEILHDPKYLIPWEKWDYSILGSCKIFSINSKPATRPPCWCVPGPGPCYHR